MHTFGYASISSLIVLNMLKNVCLQEILFPLQANVHLMCLCKAQMHLMFFDRLFVIACRLPGIIPILLSCIVFIELLFLIAANRVNIGQKTFL